MTRVNKESEFSGLSEAKRLPGLPGVYRMLGQDDSVLYVGKAVNLKKKSDVLLPKRREFVASNSING